MEYILDILSEKSSPISQLSHALDLSADDSWIFERLTPYDTLAIYEPPTFSNQNIIEILLENGIDSSMGNLYYEGYALVDEFLHNSWKVQYSELSGQLLDDISARFGFNTMAYKEAWEYARIMHEHPYSKVRCYPHVSYDDVVRDYGHQMRILSYNIRHARMNDGTNDVNLDKVIGAIKQLDCNIICLQEADSVKNLSSELNFGDYIATSLGNNWKYIFTSCYAYDGGQVGMCIIYNSDFNKVSDTSYEFASPEIGEFQRKMQIVEFDDFVIANIHLEDANDSTNQAQASAIVEYFRSHHTNKAVFLAGDFNANPQSTSISNILKSKFTILTDTSVRTTSDDTIDYIMVDTDHHDIIRNKMIQTHNDLIISDHKAITAKMFYCSDPHNLPEWLGTMRIWELSTWQEVVTVGNLYAYRKINNEYLHTDHDIFIPHITFQQYQKPTVGDAIFLMRKTLPNADLTSNPRLMPNGLLYDSENDGYWAYPKGQVIECRPYDFKQACKLYGNQNKDGNDTSFTMPCLSNFLNLNPGIQTNDSMKKVLYQQGLPRHKHDIDNSSIIDDPTTTQTLSAMATIYSWKGAGSNGTQQHRPHHLGSQGSNVKTFIGPHAVKWKLNDASEIGLYPKESTEYGEVGESYPSYVDVPIIVYIGK